MADTGEGRAEVDADHKLVHLSWLSVTSFVKFPPMASASRSTMHRVGVLGCWGVGVLRLLEASRVDARSS